MDFQALIVKIGKIVHAFESVQTTVFCGRESISPLCGRMRTSIIEGYTPKD
jgi:hypothetical protein